MLINYCFGYLFLYPLLGAYLIHIMKITSSASIMMIELFIYGVTLAISITLTLPLWKESYQVWKKNKYLVITKNIKLLIVMFIGTTICSLLISQATNTITSNNQIGITTSILHFPYVMAFATIIFAPIVEELLFRGVIYRVFRFKFSYWTGMVISSCAFGFLHIYDSITMGQWFDCWYFIVYALIGLFLCKSYEDTETIFGPILLHFLNNSIAFLFIIL